MAYCRRKRDLLTTSSTGCALYLQHTHTLLATPEERCVSERAEAGRPADNADSGLLTAPSPLVPATHFFLSKVSALVHLLYKVTM